MSPSTTAHTAMCGRIICTLDQAGRRQLVPCARPAGHTSPHLGAHRPPTDLTSHRLDVVAVIAWWATIAAGRAPLVAAPARRTARRTAVAGDDRREVIA